MDWRDYFTGGKKYDPAPENPAGLPNIEKVPPMPKCKPPKSEFIKIRNSRFRENAIVGITADMNNLQICVELTTGSVTKIGYPRANIDGMVKELLRIDETLNIEIKEPNDDQKAN